MSLVTGNLFPDVLPPSLLIVFVSFFSLLVRFHTSLKPKNYFYLLSETQFLSGYRISGMVEIIILKESYNYGHNILRLNDVLPNFHFTTSESKLDY